MKRTKAIEKDGGLNMQIIIEMIARFQFVEDMIMTQG